MLSGCSVRVANHCTKFYLEKNIFNVLTLSIREGFEEKVIAKNIERFPVEKKSVSSSSSLYDVFLDNDLL